MTCKCKDCECKAEKRELKINTPRGLWTGEVDTSLNVLTLIKTIAWDMQLNSGDKLELYLNGNKMHEDAILNDYNLNKEIVLVALGGAV